MAACMHHIVYARLKGDIGVLWHRECVHVGTQQHSGSGLSTSQHGRNTACGFMQSDVERQALK